MTSLIMQQANMLAEHKARKERLDANVERVRKKLLDRSKRGIEKYGTTTERGDLSMLDWMNHLQEELMDACVYLEAYINARISQKEGTDPSTPRS